MLSCLYAFDAPGTVRVQSEYTYHDIINNDALGTHLISMPVLVGMESINSRQDEDGASTVRTLLEYSDMATQPEKDESRIYDCSCNQVPKMVTPSMRGGVKPKQCYQHKVVPTADTGCPEMSKEFVTCMSMLFMLKDLEQ